MLRPCDVTTDCTNTMLTSGMLLTYMYKRQKSTPFILIYFLKYVMFTWNGLWSKYFSFKVRISNTSYGEKKLKCILVLVVLK